MLGRRAGVLAAVERADGIDGAIAFAVAVGLQERANVRQLAAGAAMGALAAPPVRDRQHGREGPLDPGPPGIPLLISHARHSPKGSFRFTGSLIPTRLIRVNRGHGPPRRPRARQDCGKAGARFDGCHAPAQLERVFRHHGTFPGKHGQTSWAVPPASTATFLSCTPASCRRSATCERAASRHLLESTKTCGGHFVTRMGRLWGSGVFFITLQCMIILAVFLLTYYLTVVYY